MYEWKNTILNSSKRIAIPIMTHPGIEMIGKSVKDAVCDGCVHAAAIHKLSNSYPPAATSVIMDLTVEAEAFGAEVRFADNEVPSVVGRLLCNSDDIENLKVPSLCTVRLPEYLKANEISAREITDKPVFAGMIGPFSLAGRLCDMCEIMMAIVMEPENIEKLLEKCTSFLVEYAKALKNTGVNGVIMAEPAAGLLSDDDAQKFSSQYVKRIVDTVQDESFMVVLHNCGNTGMCTNSMIATGADALSFGNAINLADVANICPKNILIWGNLDPVGVFKQGSLQLVEQKTLELLQQMQPYPNFILSTGCDVPENTPIDNIKAFYDALSTYNINL